jgi:hypothetical protein
MEVKDFLTELIDLFDKAPKDISFSADVHNITRKDLPERIKFSVPAGVPGIKLPGDIKVVHYDGGDPSGFNITMFMKKGE